MNKAKFNLRDWSSNSELLTAKAIQDKVAANSTDVNILGTKWNTLTDTLSLAPKPLLSYQHNLVTKCEVLHELSAIFNPLNWYFHSKSMATTPTMRWTITTGQPSPVVDYCWGDRTSHFYFHRQTIFYWGHPAASSFAIFTDASMKAYGAVAFLCNESRLVLYCPR